MPGVASLGGSFTLRQLWVALAGREWTSLAVVPTAGSMSSLPFATALVEAAGQCNARAAVLDANQCDLRGTARVLQEIGASRSKGIRVVAAVDSVLVSLAAVQVCLAIDGVILLVPYGEASLGSLRAAIDMVGRGRVLGCVTVPSQRPPSWLRLALAHRWVRAVVGGGALLLALAAAAYHFGGTNLGRPAVESSEGMETPALAGGEPGLGTAPFAPARPGAAAGPVPPSSSPAQTSAATSPPPASARPPVAARSPALAEGAGSPAAPAPASPPKVADASPRAGEGSGPARAAAPAAAPAREQPAAASTRPRLEKMVADALAARRAALRACVQDTAREVPGPGLAGRRIDLLLTVDPSGIVTSPKIDDPAVEEATLGGCLRNEVRKMVFPAFEGDPVQVRIPLPLGD